MHTEKRIIIFPEEGEGQSQVCFSSFFLTSMALQVPEVTWATEMYFYQFHFDQQSKWCVQRKKKKKDMHTI